MRKYELTTFSCNLKIYNKFNFMERNFNFTFVSENYTEIHSINGYKNETLIQ